MRRLLQAWLPEQRWFSGKDRELAEVTVTSTATLRAADPVVRLVLLRADYTDGGSEHYQLLLGWASNTIEPRLDHAVLGDDEGAVLYDAVHDPVATSALLQLLATGVDLDGLRFHHETAPTDDAGPLEDSDLPLLDPTLVGRVLNAEQSNTSVIYGDTLILKLFRRLQPGANPDIEVTRALANSGSTRVPRPLAWLDGTVEGEITTLGLLQPFLKGASEGWAMATASVRDLFAEGDLHAAEVGGDFAGESERLGSATAEVHQSMAQSLPTALAGPAESRQTAQQLHQRLDAALLVVPELAPYAAGLRSSYDEVAERTAPVATQRIHGDYHLGQVLRTQEGWVLLDFEGEPSRSLAERRALMSPLRDIAGMMRSFDYAARHLLAEWGPAAHLTYRANEWVDRNRDAFCLGYARVTGSDPRAEAALLRAFELDKAVYEVVYEAQHRPSWVHIPLGSIARLVQVPG